MAGWHWGMIIVVLLVGIVLGRMYGGSLPIVSGLASS